MNKTIVIIAILLLAISGISLYRLFTLPTPETTQEGTSQQTISNETQEETQPSQEAEPQQPEQPEQPQEQPETQPQENQTQEEQPETMGENEISVLSNRFEPSQLTVSSGDLVKWVNNDNKQHEVVCAAGETPLFDIILNSGDDFVFIITENTDCWDPSIQGMEMSIAVS